MTEDGKQDTTVQVSTVGKGVSIEQWILQGKLAKVAAEGQGSTADKADSGAKKPRQSSGLLREAMRMELLRFMPSLHGIMEDKRTPLHIKLGFMNTLAQYGLGQRKQEDSPTVNIQSAVVALPARQQVTGLLPEALQSVQTVQVTAGQREERLAGLKEIAVQRLASNG